MGEGIFQNNEIVISSDGEVEDSDDRKSMTSSIIGQYLSSASGRQRLAQSMVAPLRTTIDYTSIARKTFLIEPLPQGALPIYDKDPDVTSLLSSDPIVHFEFNEVTITSDGEVADSEKQNQVILPPFHVVGSPTFPIKIGSIKQRRFNLIDRAVQKARDEIMSQEDSSIFEALDKTVEVINTKE